MANSNLETLLVVFIAITGLSVLLQACVLLGMYLTMRKAVTLAKEQADEYRNKLTPVLESSKQLMGTTKELVATTKDLIAQTKDVIAGVEPQIRVAAEELAEMARSAHEQMDRIQLAADEVAENVRRQAVRVDGMTTSVLNRVDRFGIFLSEAINVPVRQVSGVVAAAKAIVETLRAPVPPKTHHVRTDVRTEDEKDLFV